MHKGNILILSNLLFNLVVALAHLYRQWETKLKVHWPLFFVHLALVIANTLLILFQVNIFFVGPASGVVCAIVVVRLLWKWLRSTRVIYSKRQFTAYCGVIYFFYVIYPVCGVIWFTSTMLPSDSLETLSQVFSLYTIAVYIYGGTQIIQTMFGLWLIVGLWSMKNGNVCFKRVQMIRLTILSALMILPNMSNYQLPYISPIIWLIWSCIVLWPRALADMNEPLIFNTTSINVNNRTNGLEQGSYEHDGPNNTNNNNKDNKNGSNDNHSKSSGNASETYSYGGASSMTTTTHPNTGSMDGGSNLPSPVRLVGHLPSYGSSGSEAIIKHARLELHACPRSPALALHGRYGRATSPVTTSPITATSKRLHWSDESTETLAMTNGDSSPSTDCSPSHTRPVIGLFHTTT